MSIRAQFQQPRSLMRTHRITIDNIDGTVESNSSQVVSGLMVDKTQGPGQLRKYAVVLSMREGFETVLYR